MNEDSAHLCRFGPFSIATRERLLFRDGLRVRKALRDPAAGETQPARRQGGTN